MTPLRQRMYAAGLRLSEVCTLELSDIESAPDRMCIKVRQDKGGKDRYTILSPRLLESLRLYWRAFRPRRWVFPNLAGDGPIHDQMVQRLYSATRDAAGLPAGGSIHTLRHAFAPTCSKPASICIPFNACSGTATIRPRCVICTWHDPV